MWWILGTTASLSVWRSAGGTTTTRAWLVRYARGSTCSDSPFQENNHGVCLYSKSKGINPFSTVCRQVEFWDLFLNNHSLSSCTLSTSCCPGPPAGPWRWTASWSVLLRRGLKERISNYLCRPRRSRRPAYNVWRNIMSKRILSAAVFFLNITGFVQNKTRFVLYDWTCSKYGMKNLIQFFFI